MTDTPVLFLVFNRPSTTRLVFGQLQKVKPSRLFIAADAARTEIPGEKELCEEVKHIVSGIDWPCEVHKLYRNQHLGCKNAVSGAITWFFDQVDEGIILEDDCLPSVSFFSFCTQMLGQYKNENTIFHINGNNFQRAILRGDGSYYYSKYAHVWGWATWKRAWSHYSLELKNWETFKQSEDYIKQFTSPEEKRYWSGKFEKYQRKPAVNNYWSYQWLYACWYYGGISITPQKNLVTNIGFGMGTNTIIALHHLIIKAEEWPPPYIKPKDRSVDKEADDYTFKNIYKYKGPISSRIKYHLHRIFGKRMP